MLAQTLPLFLAQGGMIAVVGIVCAILFGGVGGFLGYFIYKLINKLTKDEYYIIRHKKTEKNQIMS